MARKRRTISALSDIPADLRVWIEWSYRSGKNIRSIAKHVGCPRDVVSDVLDHALGSLKPGRRSGAQRAGQSAARARLAALPPPADPPAPLDITYGADAQRNRWARQFYDGPCDPAAFPDCRGHSIAEVAKSLQKNTTCTRGLLEETAGAQGPKIRKAGGRRTGPGHPLPRLLGPAHKRGAG